MFLALCLTYLPPLLIATAVILFHKSKVPLRLIIYAVILGFLLGYPAGLLNRYTVNLWDFSPLAGFTEEPLKLIVLSLFLRRRPEFKEPMDAVVYATLISLAFAAQENFDYVFDPVDGYSMKLAFSRALGAIPLHASCGIIMGYYYGQHVFRQSKYLLFLSLALPIIFHSTFNIIVSVTDLLEIIYVPLLSFYAVYLISKLLSWKRRNFTLIILAVLSPYVWYVIFYMFIY